MKKEYVRQMTNTAMLGRLARHLVTFYHQINKLLFWTQLLAVAPSLSRLLRLGHRVIANDLNPVAAVILHATLDYPTRYGLDLVPDVEKWGSALRKQVGVRDWRPLRRAAVGG